MAWSERKKGWVMVGVFGGFLVVAFSGTLMQRRAYRSMTRQEETFNTIDYAGEVFKLTRAYSDYEDYKDDPNNLAPGQEQKLEKAVMHANVSKRYASWSAMIEGLFDLKFPGYGMATFRSSPDNEGYVLEAFLVEIPRTGKDRLVVYRGKSEDGRPGAPAGGPFRLVDDFQTEDNPRIAEVRIEAGELVYSTSQGKVAARRKVQ